MTVALIHPPTCDPTAPYVAVPLLTAVLRARGFRVLPVDANLEAWERLLTGDALAVMTADLRARFRDLDRAPGLRHREQLALVDLAETLAECAAAPRGIDDAVATLRDPGRFFDDGAYGRAVATVEAAQRIVGAWRHPLEVDFRAYRTPFSLLDPDEIERDAGPDRDPFHGGFRDLAGRLAREGAQAVGVSVVFPGQVQPALALGRSLRAALPGAWLVLGGPAATQLFRRLDGDLATAVLGPYDAVVAGEGEGVLPGLLDRVAAGDRPRGVLEGGAAGDLGDLPAPDFDGLPLDRYLSPEPVLPYDAARGCYWGKCAFCHYGLAEAGTAPYRERPADRVAADLAALAARHGAGVFYLSEDTLAPRGALALADRLRGTALRWATDVRPEPRFARDDAAARLAAGGCLAVSLGVESGCPRVLARIDKGVTPDQAAEVARALAGAGIAVEAMAFTGFPGETASDARATVRWLGAMHDHLSLFICGEFELTPGSRVARDPAAFGVRSTWRAAGDRLGTALFFDAPGAARDAVEDAVQALSARWRLRLYPWAGSLSTAHTLLWYRRHGPDVFRRLGGRPDAVLPRGRRPASRHDLDALGGDAREREGAIWDRLVNRMRTVGRGPYERLASLIDRGGRKA